mgnify:CR=1 FL=1
MHLRVAGDASSQFLSGLLLLGPCLPDGLIIEHRDSFDFYRWSRQALGVPGLLLGWSSFLQNKVRAQAAANLKRYLGKA